MKLMNCRYTVKRVPEAAVPIWIAVPNQRWLDGSHQEPLPGMGRREVLAPQGSMVAATWREAMDWVIRRRYPRPLAAVYPQFCGICDISAGGTEDPA